MVGDVKGHLLRHYTWALYLELSAMPSVPPRNPDRGVITLISSDEKTEILKHHEVRERGNEELGLNSRFTQSPYQQNRVFQMAGSIYLRGIKPV